MRAILTLLTVATVLVTPLAQAATGDLDPSFANHGRLAPIGAASGEALFVEPLSTGGILVGGGNVRASGSLISDWPGGCTFRIKGSNFMSQLDERGAMDPGFNAAPVPDFAAIAMTRQADGGIIVLGHEIKLVSTYRCSHSTIPMLFRLESDGSLDAAFGMKDLRQLAGLQSARSLVLDQHGRIVIAGVRPIEGDHANRTELTVLRLRSNGTLDGSFGVDGSYSGPVADGVVFYYRGPVADGSNEIDLTPIGSGGYRVAAQSTHGCVIVAITADGAPDSTFGTEGVMTPHSPVGARVNCNALASAPDGSLLVAGSARKHGFVARLLASGAPDPAFVVDTGISVAMTGVTSVAIAADGKLLVAGTGPRGASILRLHGTGERDTAFGDAGRTWIDLDWRGGAQPIVRDMKVQEDGGVIAAGGNSNSGQFVVRLLGDAGGTSRGVVGFSRWYAAPQESDGKAVLRVRRSGGSDGNVSARYRTSAADAKSRQDFVPAVGRLFWTAGDTSEREIVISLANGGVAPEALESFHVVLDNVYGGAGLGIRGATVDIQPDGSPGGQIEIDLQDRDASESSLDGQFILLRNYYFQGRVCVTFTAKSGTAIAGKDFRAEPQNVCWHDQDTDWRLPEIQIVDDNLKEGNETFTIELSNPTGGAIIGPHGSATITLYDND